MRYGNRSSWLSPHNAASTSIADEITKLAELRDKGLLTNEEFQAQKGALLAKQAG